MESMTKVSVPKSLMYGMNSVTAVSGSTVLRQFGASNGNSFNTATNEIRIPVNAGNGFLLGAKSYLAFTIVNGNADKKLTLDSDALCWCDQLRVESQGLVLERLDRAALYNNIRAVMAGGPERDARACKSGAKADTSASNDGEEIAAAKSGSYVCNLPLGFLKNHLGRAIPSGVSFDLIIRVNSNAVECFKWEAADDVLFSVTNPRFYAPVAVIDNPNIINEYRATVAKTGINWSGDVVKTYVSAIAEGTGPQTFQINDRSQSLKALVSAQRGTGDAMAAAKNKSATNLATMSSYSYNIQGQSYPQDTVTISVSPDSRDVGRAFEECQKVFADYGDDYSKPHTTLSLFAGTAAAGTGVVGVDLRRFDDHSLKMTGLNTALGGSPSTLEVNFDTAVAGNMTTFGIAEAVWSMGSDGRISVSM